MMIDPEQFRETLRFFGSGVTIVTVRSENRNHGMTVSAFTSVSADPPLVAIVINQSCLLHHLLGAPDGFAVNMLTSEQAELSDRFAFHREGDRFLVGDWTVARTGAPVLKSALAWLDCTLVDRHSAGSHTIFFGAVEASSANRDDGRPLIYWNRDYRKLK